MQPWGRAVLTGVCGWRQIPLLTSRNSGLFQIEVGWSPPCRLRISRLVAGAGDFRFPGTGRLRCEAGWRWGCCYEGGRHRFRRRVGQARGGSHGGKEVADGRQAGPYLGAHLVRLVAAQLRRHRSAGLGRQVQCLAGCVENVLGLHGRLQGTVGVCLPDFDLGVRDGHAGLWHQGLGRRSQAVHGQLFAGVFHQLFLLCPRALRDHRRDPQPVGQVQPQVGHGPDRRGGLHHRAAGRHFHRQLHAGPGGQAQGRPQARDVRQDRHRDPRRRAWRQVRGRPGSCLLGHFPGPLRHRRGLPHLLGAGVLHLPEILQVQP